MTKRVLIALVLLLLALSLSVTGYAILQNKIAALGQALENAVYTESPIEDSLRMIEQNAALCITWMHILTPHKDLEALITEIRMLRTEQTDAPAFRRACRKCIVLLDEIRREQQPTLENIL